MLNSIGLIETKGLTAAVEAADVMLKNSKVKLLSKELTNGNFITVVVSGEPEQVQLAVNHGAAAAKRFGKLVTAHVIVNPSKDLVILLPSLNQVIFEQKDETNDKSDSSTNISSQVEKDANFISSEAPPSIVPINEQQKKEPETINKGAKHPEEKRIKESIKKKQKIIKEEVFSKPDQPATIHIVEPAAVPKEIEETQIGNVEIPDEKEKEVVDASAKETNPQLGNKVLKQISTPEAAVSLENLNPSIGDTKDSNSDAETVHTQKRKKKVKEYNIKTPSLFDTDFGNETIARLKREALGALDPGIKDAAEKEEVQTALQMKTQVQPVGNSEHTNTIASKSLEELSELNVHQLRRAARDFEKFPIKGRQISKANRDILLNFFRELL